MLLALLCALDAQALLNSPVVAALLVTLIGAAIAIHPLMKLAAWLHADAQRRAGLAKVLEDGGGSLAEKLDAFLSANGQDVKDLVDPAKRAAAEAHLADQGKAAVATAIKGAASVLLLVLGLGLSSCAHSEPLLVTGDAIVATGKTFEATAQVMSTLKPQLSPDQLHSWQLFEMRFKTSFHAARQLYDAAASGGDVSTQQAAARIIADFAAELGTYEALILQLVHPDGGAS